MPAGAALGKLFVKRTRPFLAKLLRADRPLASDWRLDPAPRPAVLPFDPHSPAVVLERQQRDAAVAKKMSDLRRPFRILSLDGGGVRGAITIGILQRILRHDPAFLSEVDFICGTSAGGLITLLLGAGYSADDIADMYRFAGPHIFGYDPWRAVNPFRARYSDRPKEEILKHYFGSRTMSDLHKTCAVVAFRLDGRKSSTHSFFNRDGWRPAVFTNMPRAAGLVEPDFELQLWDAAMRTSAAPTFFPVFHGYVDGGIVANNPSVIAITKAMAHYPSVTLRNVVVLSIGE